MEERVQYGDDVPFSAFRTLRELSTTLADATKDRLSIPRIFCVAMGDSLEGGLFLAHLYFWHDKGKSDDGWFYKSYPEWENETFLSAYKVKSYAEQCCGYGWLATEVRKANGAPTVYYKLDLVGFLRWIDPILKNFIIETEKFQYPGKSKISFSYKQNITTDINSSSTDDNPVEEDGNPLPFSQITDYWRVSVSGKKLTKGQEEWLWSLFQELKGDLLLESLREAVRNNSRGGLPTYNFVRAIGLRKRKENEASAQRRLALTEPTVSPEYVDPAWEKLRKEIMDGNQRDS